MPNITLHLNKTTSPNRKLQYNIEVFKKQLGLDELDESINFKTSQPKEHRLELENLEELTHDKEPIGNGDKLGEQQGAFGLEEQTRKRKDNNIEKELKNIDVKINNRQPNYDDRERRNENKNSEREINKMYVKDIMVIEEGKNIEAVDVSTNKTTEIQTKQVEDNKKTPNIISVNNEYSDDIAVGHNLPIDVIMCTDRVQMI
eukprot:Ihof_evm9s66 gene=Ihof_evmTU9s66